MLRAGWEVCSFVLFAARRTQLLRPRCDCSRPNRKTPLTIRTENVLLRTLQKSVLGRRVHAALARRCSNTRARAERVKTRALHNVLGSIRSHWRETSLSWRTQHCRVRTSARDYTTTRAAPMFVRYARSRWGSALAEQKGGRQRNRGWGAKTRSAVDRRGRYGTGSSRRSSQQQQPRGFAQLEHSRAASSQKYRFADSA